uniref:Peptidase M13 C-terminal domain-containing protein n=1 Tax=Parascaris equorum TaxID=6256 RepID=A0A914S310_PAREQ
MTQSENIADNGGLRAAYKTWCSKVRPKAVVDLLLNDVHSPERYRVNVVLANQPEFFDAFNCPLDSAMKMDRRCRIW